MVSISDIKWYKSAGGGLGGAINLGAPIVSGEPNNFFPLVTQAEALSGTVKYLLLYVKNEGAEELVDFTFWEYQGSTSHDTQLDWGKGSSGRNGTEATIPNTYTEPLGVSWVEDNTKKEFPDLDPGDRYPIWFRLTVGSNTLPQKSDTAVYKFNVTIPAGGTGTPPDPSGGGGGGSGGNPTPTPTNWKIAVAGDWDGSNSRTDDVMDLCEDYDAIINTGDNAYGDPQDWIDKVNNHNLKSKFIGNAYGNHEYDDGVNDYKTYFGHSKTYFYKKFENVCVITIDTNIDLDPGSAQHDAVEGFLEDATTDANIDWIFACMHHPWFGSNSDHDYNEEGQVDAFHSLFTSNKVAFVFTGHNHNFQRTHKVSYNSGDPEDPNLIDTDSTFSNTTSGLVHVVSGTGGHDGPGNFYPLDDELGGDNPNAYQNRSHNGIYSIEASNNGKTLTCRFKDTDGDVHDTITYTAT